MPTSASERRILALCHKVVALPSDSDEFEPAIRELKTAIHEQLEEVRAQVAEMARMSLPIVTLKQQIDRTAR